MKLTIRNTQVREGQGQMVGVTVLGNGSVADEIDSWMTNNTSVIAGAAAQGASDWLDDNVTQPTTPVIDASLSISGAAADAKKTGDEIGDLKSDLGSMQTATASDVGKSLQVKTVANGKVTEWEFGNSVTGLSTKDITHEYPENLALNTTDLETYLNVNVSSRIVNKLDLPSNQHSGTVGQVLKKTANGSMWEDESGGGASALSDLTDASIQSAANGNVLRYDGTAGKWKNVSPPWAEMTETRSGNYFNKEDISDGVFYPWDGTILDYQGTFHSYIPCEAGTYTFLMPHWLFTNNTGRVPYFNSSKTYINEIIGTVTEYDDRNSLVTITISETEISAGCAYFGFSESNDLLDTLMVVKGSTYPPAYIPYSATIRTIEGLQISASQIVGLVPGGGALSGLSDVSVQSAANGNVLRYDNTLGKWKNVSPSWAEMSVVTSINVFDPNDISSGIFLPWDGSIMAYSGTFHSYIPCEAGTYTFLMPSEIYTANTGRVPYFSSNKTYIDEIRGSVTEYDSKHSLVTITISSTEISAGCAYFGFSESNSLLSTLMVVKGATYPSSYIAPGTIRTIEGLQISASQIVDFEPENILAGKIASFNGDSICAGAGFGGGYAGIIGSESNMIIDNIAVSGATITPGTGVVHIISTSINDMRSDADYVILEGGVNDADYQVTLGTITGGYTSTLDTTTFAGAFESMLKSALSRFPGKKIGYIITHKCSDRFDSRSTDSYYNIAIAACKKWGIPYLDLNTEVPPLGYIDALRTTYTSNGDGYHPNEAGYKAYYVPKITAWMKTL